MKSRWLFGVLISIFLFPIAFAANINESSTLLIMDDSLTINTLFDLYTEEPIKNLTLILPEQSKNLDVQIDNQERKCLLQATFARCGELEKGNHMINYSYFSKYPIAKLGENTVIKYVDELPYTANSQKVELQLPVGYVIPRETGKDERFYINPKPEGVHSDGQRIILTWRQKGQMLSISVLTKKLTTLSTGWIAFFILLAIVLAAIVAFFVLRTDHKKIQKKSEQKIKPKQKPKEEVIPGLMEAEQKVVDILKEKGEIWQKQLLQETGFSKAKLSRTIRNLEQREVVTRTIYGNANKISLKNRQ
ncbi:hypothetical protein COV18_05825 [Candidatus Woesearchaeota archaeon CG10_big_fil_rev_8_21_14_0_10_37_12]|nr:MAG: hypothetical protein COV18_05825 [Candidatus Woesearchaeota archaeon CG10_big_fil_rev_8_21_14_0_10_37_12]